MNEIFPLVMTSASLAMDAFSVSICIGLCHDGLKRREALILGSAFGGFQFLMPLLGGEIAEHLSGFFDRWTPWIAAALILWVAINMIREACQPDGEEKCCMTITLKNVVVLAVATSLDALAVGFSIESTGGSAFLLAVLAGVITFTLSYAGAMLGKRLGETIGKYAEYCGGFVLTGIAAKIILQALEIF